MSKTVWINRILKMTAAYTVKELQRKTKEQLIVICANVQAGN